MRADRLLSLVLLLQARGRATAQVIAAELEVSVRTVYRDLEALVAAGVPVLTESGPGGGCRLMQGYRFPLRGLRPDEAEALLILGVPGVLRELGLDAALDAAQRHIRVTAGDPDLNRAALVHLDMPRWFGSQEDVPCLRELARALRSRRRLTFRYRAPGEASQVGQAGEAGPRVVGPLGLVNKAGLWYLVAASSGGVHDRPEVRVFRVARIVSARPLAEPVERPPGFELAAFWRQWSAELENHPAPGPGHAPRLAPGMAILVEVFGQAAGPSSCWRRRGARRAWLAGADAVLRA